MIRFLCVWKCLAFGGVVALLLGCGNGETYVPVTGVVTLDGQPLSDAKLIFEPVGDAKGVASGKPSYGRTDSMGRFSLNCPIANEDGAVVGTHRVRVVTTKVASPTEEQISKARQILEKEEIAGGNLNPEISAEQISEYLSDMVRPTRKESLPAKYNVDTELTIVVDAGGTDSADFSLESK
ncbi:hypothetical protein FF011L_41850 [Roseimaritima multifibrata]|uniref:Carboxypeptidase regulatory-like domain-containing protein n=1 Tax=Roseimaritima multifibrata TaxID=1930274 RepID=A0A517MKH3_9BACT|nr:DUF4198 domain-containing protein [Roseimaritima multifibrata]QDS95389.1 hypothetical protein FF011L_41850 [Roseimaritima multifibrata]